MRINIFCCILLLFALAGESAAESEPTEITLFKQGKAALGQGAPQEAISLFESSLEICTAQHNSRCRMVNLTELGTLYDQSGRRDDALRAYQETLSIKRQLDSSPQSIMGTLNDVGEALHSLRRYQEAVASFEEAYAMAESLGIKEASAALLNSMGMSYFALNRLEKALESFNDSMRIRKELGAPRELLVQNLNNIGSVYVSSGQYQQALPYLEEAVAIFREINNPEAVATGLNNLGYAYASFNRHDKALASYEEALGLRRTLNTPLETATVLNNMGLLFSSIGRHEEAIVRHEEALQIRKAASDRKGIAESLNNTGYAQRTVGEYDQALNNFEETLKIHETLNDRRAVSTGLNNLATVYDTLGQYDKALQYHERALGLRRELNIQADVAVTLNNIGMIQINLGRYDKALAAFEESLALKKQHQLSPESIAVSLNNIGAVLDSIGQQEKALGYYRQALEIRREQNLAGAVGQSLSNIGSVYLTLKRYPEAERTFVEAEQEVNKSDRKMKGNPGLVELYLATGAYDRAMSLLETMAPGWSTEDATRIQYHTQMGMALKGLGRLKEATGELLTAVSLSEETRYRIKDRSGFFASGLAGGRIRSYRVLLSVLCERALKGDLIDKRLAHLGKDTADSAFYLAESIKARTLLESMAEVRRTTRRRIIPEEWKRKEQSLLQRLSALDEQWETAYRSGEAAVKELNGKRAALRAQFQELIGMFRKKSPRYAALYYPAPIPAATLPLRKDETVLEFVFGDDACYLFIVRTGGVKQVIRIESSPEELEKSVKAFMEPLNNNHPDLFSEQLARELGKTLLAGAQTGIKSGSKVIIVPDGLLGLIPFGALMTEVKSNEHGKVYLDDRWVITYEHSSSALALDRLLRPVKARKPLFALGNPVFDATDPRYVAYKQGKAPVALLPGQAEHYPFRGLAIHAKPGSEARDQVEWEQVVFAPLPESEVEVKAIAAGLGVKPVPPDVLLGMNANKTTFLKSQLEEYRYIHFATHADLPGNVQGVKEPFILLGQVANDEQDRGFLTLSEILELQLSADMVMLSACNTGKGELVAGEGVANLARAFQHAGARSVVSSLWEVASDAAVEYMKSFYGHMKTTGNRAVALSLARKEIKQKYPSPFYWAVFAFYGDGG